MDRNRIEELKKIYEQNLIKYERDHRGYLINLKGIEFEKKGKVDDAIAMYELNVQDNFAGLHPYKRLSIIYIKLKLIKEAERVLRKGIENVFGDNHRNELEKRLLKIIF
jgi:tetratricopeptide (TPR) repeat protein